MILEPYFAILPLMLLFFLLIFLSSKGKISMSIGPGPLTLGILFWGLTLTSVIVLFFLQSELNTLQKALLGIFPFTSILLVTQKTVTFKTKVKGMNGYPIRKPYRNQEEATGPSLFPSHDCCTKLVTIPKRDLSSSRGGNTGGILWHLFLSHYYEWELQYRFEVTERTVKVFVRSFGRFSSNFQFSANNYDVVAETEIDIVCIPEKTGCTAVASGPDAHEHDGPFEAAYAVEVVHGSGLNMVTISCKVMATVKGRIFIDKVDVGVKDVVSTSVSIHNKAQDFLSAKNDFIFRCVPCAQIKNLS